MQLLTFLGIFRLETTQFTWEDKLLLENPSPYVVEALLKLNNIKQITVFLTPEAEAHENWAGLMECISKFKGLSIQPVSIPSGRTEKEFWQLFDAVVSAVQPKSEIIFDITHAFRSIPFLAFLAAAFLQKARAVKVKGVYYGAFEREQPQTPILDLTSAIKLLDWLTATDKFITTGSAVDLGNLLKTIQGDFYRSASKEGTQPRLLQKLGNSIQEVSLALELIRSFGLLEKTAQLQTIPADKLKEELGSFAKPFELLLGQIQDSYGQFALSKPRELENNHSVLQKQFLLLGWYKDKELGSQAILLAREWIVSALCVAQDTNYLNHKERDLIEKQLNLMVDWKKLKGSGNTIAGYSSQSIIEAVQDVEELVATWSTLTQYRNDLAHPEYSANPIAASTLQNYVKNDLILKLTALFPKFAA